MVCIRSRILGWALGRTASAQRYRARHTSWPQKGKRKVKLSFEWSFALISGIVTALLLYFLPGGECIAGWPCVTDAQLAPYALTAGVMTALMLRVALISDKYDQHSVRMKNADGVRQNVIYGPWPKC